MQSMLALHAVLEQVNMDGWRGEDGGTGTYEGNLGALTKLS